MRFPCALDSDWQIWKSVGAKDWPTILVLSPDYRILYAIPSKFVNVSCYCGYLRRRLF